MGSEHLPPGKGRRHEYRSADHDALAPGKRTLTSKLRPAAPAPAPIAWQGGEKPSKLGAVSRAQLIGMVSAAIGRAHTAYMAALGSLELEHKIENPAELPLWASVLFSVGGKLLEVAFSLSVKALRTAGAIEHELVAAGVRVPEHAAEGLAHELNDKAWEAGISVSIDTGKEAVKAPTARAISGDDQSVALGYIDALRDGSMFMFAQLANKVYELDDAALVAANKALAPENILFSKFKTFLEEKIAAFMKTKIRDIGTRSGGKLGVMEHKVGWMYEPGATKPRLIYVDEGFAPAYGTPGPAYDSVPKLSLGQDATWTANEWNTTREKQHAEFRGHADASGVRFVGPVEEEFTKEAVAQHKATWLEAPRNYRQITNDGAPRLEAM